MSEKAYTRADMYSPGNPGALVTDESLRWILAMNGTGCVTTHHVFDMVMEIMALRAEYAELEIIKERMGSVVGALMAQGKVSPEDVQEAIRRYDEKLAEREES